MKLWLSLLAFTLATTIISALEEVPHASGLKKLERKTTVAPPVASHVRRAPIIPAQGLSLLPHAHRMSTGVRRAPTGATAPHPRAPPRPAVKFVRPGPPGVAPPGYMMVPVPILQLPQIPMMQMTPQVSGRAPVVTLSPLALPTLPPFTLPQLPSHQTLPPAPGGPITLAPMPIMPGLTMPPSFQRLLGMTSTTETPERREIYQREEKRYTDERAIKRKKGLSSVASRLPKYVDNEEDVVTPEKNAEWIVPFKF